MAIKVAPRIKQTVLDYSRGDFDGLQSTLVSDLSSAMDKKDNVNKSWSKWKSTFLAAVDQAIPKKCIKNVHSSPWINGEIIHAIKKKETVRRQLKSSSSSSLMEKFKELQNKVKQPVNESRTHFFETIDVDLCNNPKRFWSVFKLKSKSSSVPEIVSIRSGSDAVYFLFVSN